MTKSIVTGLALTGLVLGLCWGAISFHQTTGSMEIISPKVVRTALPLSLEAARVECPILLPDSASNIEYALWSFGQSTQAFVRFEAPGPDCLEHAREIMKPFMEHEGLSVVSLNIVGVPPALCVLDPTEVDLAWFDLSQLTEGKVFRVDGGRAPMVWVDTRKGAFYYEGKNSVCRQDFE